MIFFMILLFFIFFLSIPIPIKITAYYSIDDYYLKLYGINLYSKTDGIIRKILNRKSKLFNKMDREGKFADAKFENKDSKKKVFYLRKFYRTLQTNKFKPYIKFSLLGEYSLGDAALTAILYGFFSNLNFIFHKILSDFFKVKKLNYSFNPNFKENININLYLNCIITFNFAQIIYMLFLIRKKEVSL